MSSATIAANFNQTFNVQGFLTAEVTFNFLVLIQSFTDLSNFFFSQVANASVRVNTGFS